MLRVAGVSKREDDRVKVLVGAAVLNSLQRGHPLELKDRAAVLALMDDFLKKNMNDEKIIFQKLL